MDKKTTRALAQGLPLITQFGLSLAVPPAVCLFGAGWLRTQFCLGEWIIGAAVVLAVAGVVSACGNCFCIMLRRAEEDERAYREVGY